MIWMLLVFFGACSYGLLSTFVKFAYADGFTVGDVSSGQLFVSALLIWLFALFARGGRPNRNSALALLSTGLTIGLTSLLYYASLQYLTASVAIVMLFQFTWVGVLIESLLRRKWPEADKLASLALLLVGTVLASGLLEAEQEFSLVGAALGFLSAVSYALFILFSGKVALQVNPWMRSAMMSTGAMVLVWAIFPPAFLWNGALADGLWLWIALLGLFNAIPTVCFTLGVPRIDTTLAIILGSAELPMAVFMSRFVLHEPVSLLQWTGVAAILLGIALPELYRRKRRPSPDPQRS